MRFLDLKMKMVLIVCGLIAWGEAHAATVSSAAPMSNQRREHTATLLPSGKVLVAAGIGGDNGPLVNTSEVYDPASNSWSSAGTLSVPKQDHTATLLLNGKVLVVGGQNGNGLNGPLSSVDLYNPSTNTWTATASLNTARFKHTATLLPNGKLLVVGGNTNTVEIYDPSTDKWSVAASLSTPLSDHTATLLPNGKVLVAGGFTGSSHTNSARLYDPTSNTWSATGSMSAPREAHTSTLLLNGKVLVAAGLNNPVTVKTAELYDPTTGLWSLVGSLATVRYTHTASLLPNGQVLVTGGEFGNGNSESSAELFDPTNNTWSTTASLSHVRETHTATLLPNGKVLICGGFDYAPYVGLSSVDLYDPSTNAGNFSLAANHNTARNRPTATLMSNGNVLVASGTLPQSSSLLTSAEVYQPSSNKWTTVASSMSFGRYYHAASLLASGKVLVTGGVNFGFPSQSVAAAEYYDPSNDTWNAAGSLTTARYFHTSTLLSNGKVLVAAGFSGFTNGTLKSAELYDPAGNSWSVAASLAAVRRSHSATLLQNGKVLAVGGFDDNTSAHLASVELYDPASNTWSAVASLNTGRDSHKATLLANGNVLVAGGSGASGILASSEIYNPTNNTWTVTGSLITGRQDYSMTLLPNGKVLVTGGASSGGGLTSAELYDPASGVWTATGNMSAIHGEHNATLLPNGQVLIGTSNGNAPELYNSGQQFLTAAQPVIATATNPLPNGNPLILTGSLFTGLSEASGGSYNNSASNNPIVQIQSLSNGQILTVVPDPNATWTATTYSSTSNPVLPLGYASVTVTVNGIQSAATLINVVKPVVNFAFGAVSPATPVTGQTVTIPFSFTKNVGTTPTGSVIIGDGTTQTTVSINAGTATLSFPTSGTRTIALTYSGDANFGPSATTLLYTVNKAATSVVLGTISPASSTASQSITVPFSVPVAAPGTGTPTGNVTVSDGVSSATVPVATGTATLALVTAGNRTLTISYAGDFNFASSQTTTPYTVAQAGTTIVLGTISPASSIASQTVTIPFTATVNAPGSGAPPGNVTVGDGVTSVSVPASSGTATLAFPTKGNRTLSVTYAGTSSFAASNASAPYSVGVASTTTVAGPLSPAASVSGQAVFIPFTVSVNAPGIGAPAGNVIVSDGTTSATVPAASGSATLSFPDAHSRIISIVYQGTVDFNPSSVTPFSYTVNKAGTGLITGVITPAVAVTGQSITVPFTVSVTAPGVGTPTGNVVVGDGISSVTVPVGSGIATLGLSTFGVRNLTVAYQGDLNFSATSANTAFGINKAQTSVSIGSITPANAAAGQTITIPFNVNVTAPGAGLPTGDVTVGDGVTTVTAHISDGFATLAFPTQGPRSITITYPGDANFNGSSGNTSFTVLSNAPTIASSATATGAVGQAFSYTISASGVGPFTFFAQPLPDGLTLKGSVISGTPTAAGATNVTLSATNASGSSAPFTLAITVNPSGAPLITSSLQVSTPVGTKFTYVITSSGNSPVTFSATNLPQGLTFSGNTIIGTPMVLGSTRITLTATNALGSDTEVLTLTVSALGTAVITSPSFVNTKAGAQFSYTITASGTGPITFGASNLPTGLTLTGNTLSGMAPPVGNYPATITATNAGGTVAQSLLIGVFPNVALSPLINGIAISRNPAMVNTPIAFTADVLNQSGQSLSFTWTFFSDANTPDGVVLTGNPVTRQFASEGTFYVAVFVTDGFNDGAKSDKLIVGSLAPNSGTSAPNILDDGAPSNTATNPTDGLGISVSSSKGGAVNVDSVTTGTELARASTTYKFTVDGKVTDPNPQKAQNSGAKFQFAGIKIVQLETSSGATSKIARLMLPVGQPEIASSSINDDRTSKTFTSMKISGAIALPKTGQEPARVKQIVTNVKITVGVSVPSGLAIADLSPSANPMDIGISSLHTQVSLDPSKGKVTSLSDSGHFQKMQVKLPKLDKTKKTVHGGQMIFSFTMSGADAYALGFKTDGVAGSAATSLQFAAVIGGVTYYGKIPVAVDSVGNVKAR